MILNRLKIIEVINSPHRLESSSNSRDAVITVIPENTGGCDFINIISNVKVTEPVVSTPIIETF